MDHVTRCADRFRVGSLALAYQDSGGALGALHPFAIELLVGLEFGTAPGALEVNGHDCVL